MRAVGTTYTPDSSLEEWEEEKARARWIYTHFTQHLTPSARGGFEDVDPDEIAQPPSSVISCRACGALVLTGEWYGLDHLNLHRTWHDTNDRSSADD